MARWNRRVLLMTGASVLATLVVIWQLAAYVVERPAPASGSLPPTCDTYIDSHFRHALPVLRAQAAALINTRRIPGLAIAVWRDGYLVYHEGFGYADLARRTPACPTTRFRSASVSKLFTSA